MNFDALLRGYLDGTLSDRELERFQTLVDRFPQYRTELLQTLELRSALQDDALTLFPPSMLLERVRLSVAAAFAAEFGEKNVVESEENRRAWLAPLRVAAGSLVAVCLAVGIALSPTISFEPLASVDPSSTAGNGEFASTDRAVSAPPQRSVAKSSRNRVALPVVMVASTSDDQSDALTPADAAELVDAPPAPLQSTVAAPAHRSLRSDVAALLTDAGGFTAEGGVTDVLDTRPASIADPIVAAMVNEVHDRAVDDKDRYRRLAIGVLVGSGQVAELKSFTALLQNSYYFAFGVNPHDRFGLEMGASAFERQERVTASSAGGGFAKPSQGSPESSDRIKDDANAQGQRGSASLITRQYEQQITYGGIFYDRRLRVNASWDLCGRVTVGGADNAVVGGIRAYAAYTPSANRNITLTLGVGGSGLLNLTERDNNTGGNYGIYYGIETGF